MSMRVPDYTHIRRRDMRIGGEVALSLPDSDSRTIWLTMSPEEAAMYKKAKKGAGLCIDTGAQTQD